MKNSMNNPDENYFSAAELAAMKSVTPQAVYAAMKGGRLPYTLILGRANIHKDDAEAWQPVRYAGREGAAGRGGRPKGRPVSASSRAKMSRAAKKRWAKFRKARK